MARQTALALLRVDADSPVDPDRSPLSQQRSQARVRRSACSDLQSTAIPEGRVYNGNRRRASLFVSRSSQVTAHRAARATSPSGHDELSRSDYVEQCRQRCQSLYRSLARSTLSMRVHDRPVAKSDADELADAPQHEMPARRAYRYSLPDASPAASLLRHFLKRNKTANNQHAQERARVQSPSRCSSSAVPMNASSPKSTFHQFLSLVKISSSKSSQSTHHSSLTTLCSPSVGSQTPLNRTANNDIDWLFEVTMWPRSSSIGCFPSRGAARLARVHTNGHDARASARSFLLAGRIPLAFVGRHQHDHFGFNRTAQSDARRAQTTAAARPSTFTIDSV
jgi:hypothetical protein